MTSVKLTSNYKLLKYKVYYYQDRFFENKFFTRKIALAFMESNEGMLVSLK